MNKGKIKYIFTSSHTKDGFFTFIPDLIEGVRQVYILKGPAGSGKSTLIRLLGETIYEQGYEVEFWISAIDPINPDGVYIPQLGAAVINGSLPHPIDPSYPGGIGEIINLGDFIDGEESRVKRNDIEKLITEVGAKGKQAYHLLHQAGIIKHEIKKIVSKHLNMSKIKNLIDDLAQDILNEQPREKHYFASALTADGMINYIDELSAGCQKRYILIGPEGSAKSMIIHELAAIFKEKGFIMEYYHSGFDTDSLDMIIIKNLQVALIDGGNAEVNIKPWDIVIDMIAFLESYEIDRADMLKSESHRNYETLILEAQTELDNMRGSLKDLKKLYSALADFERLDAKRENLRVQIVNQT